MSKYHALILDDEKDICELIQLSLEKLNITCTTTHNIKQAKSALQKHSFSVCLTDMRLPDGDGLELVRLCQQQYPAMPIAVLTAHGNMENAIKALKLGAFDFLNKPIQIDHLRNTIQQALVLEDHPEPFSASKAPALIGDSPAIQELRTTVQKVARSQAPVLILGESGAGKELVARLIHQGSSRQKHSFIPVNCAAIPSELVESEFFGHVKGSFTGAIADHPGLFQSANGGTLFLDEIGDLPQFMQVKLLRALQEKSVRPVGSSQEVKVDVRLVSATHRDLQQAVTEGKFRQDFYYRINVIHLQVPPLRQRREDLPLLIKYLLQKIAKKENIAVPKISPKGMEKLLRYHYPGNVRELENILERAVALRQKDTLDLTWRKFSAASPATSDTSSDTQSAESTLPLGQEQIQTTKESAGTLEDMEKQHILAALEATRWNRTAAAKQLGISLRSLRYRLQKYNLD